MPDVREIENTLFGLMEFYRSDVELDRRDQRDRGQQDEIGDDQHLAGPIVPKFDEFYME